MKSGAGTHAGRRPSARRDQAQREVGGGGGQRTKEAGPGEGAGGERLEHAREGSRLPRALAPASVASAMSHFFFFPECGEWPMPEPRPAPLLLAVGVGLPVFPLGGDPGPWD